MNAKEMRELTDGSIEASFELLMGELREAARSKQYHLNVLANKYPQDFRIRLKNLGYEVLETEMPTTFGPSHPLILMPHLIISW